MKTRGSIAIVGVILVLTALPFLFRMYQLWPLYVSPSVRSHVQAQVKRITDERGWLLSDFELTRVTKTDMRFRLRQHKRGADPVHCFTANLSGSSVLPCGANL